MDPNATLQTIRTLVAEIPFLNSRDEYSDAAHGLAEHVKALDEWITSGGYLPIDWAMHLMEATSNRMQQARELGAQEGFSNGYRLALEHVSMGTVDGPRTRAATPVPVASYTPCHAYVVRYGVAEHCRLPYGHTDTCDPSACVHCGQRGGH